MLNKDSHTLLQTTHKTNCRRIKDLHVICKIKTAGENICEDIPHQRSDLLNQNRKREAIKQEEYI